MTPKKVVKKLGVLTENTYLCPQIVKPNTKSWYDKAPTGQFCRGLYRGFVPPKFGRGGGKEQNLWLQI